MTYQYTDIQTTNELGYRWYHTKFGAYPSITSVLSGTQSDEAIASLQAWKDSMGHERAEEVSRAARDHGTNVHLLIERYLKKEDPLAPIHGEPVPLNDITAFNALKLKLNKIDEVWGQEVPLVSKELEVAGRCDFVGVYKKLPVIIDFKTAGRIKARDDIKDYFLQLAFYANAHNEMFNTNIKHGVILMTSGAGFPLEFTEELTEHTALLRIRVSRFWEKLLNTQDL